MSLRKLNVAWCGLRSVPAFVGELDSLEVLDLTRNWNLEENQKDHFTLLISHCFCSSSSNLPLCARRGRRGNYPRHRPSHGCEEAQPLRVGQRFRCRRLGEEDRGLRDEDSRAAAVAVGGAPPCRCSGGAKRRRRSDRGGRRAGARRGAARVSASAAAPLAPAGAARPPFAFRPRGVELRQLVRGDFGKAGSSSGAPGPRRGRRGSQRLGVFNRHPLRERRRGALPVRVTGGGGAGEGRRGRKSGRRRGRRRSCCRCRERHRRGGRTRRGDDFPLPGRHAATQASYEGPEEGRGFIKRLLGFLFQIGGETE